jgi:hypothetical protein
MVLLEEIYHDARSHESQTVWMYKRASRRLYRLTEDEHMLEQNREYPYTETLLARARNHDIQGT